MGKHKASRARLPHVGLLGMAPHVAFVCTKAKTLPLGRGHMLSHASFCDPPHYPHVHAPERLRDERDRCPLSSALTGVVGLQVPQPLTATSAAVSSPVYAHSSNC
eukprot:843904-Prorocentrum_minimum.AAC.3